MTIQTFICKACGETMRGSVCQHCGYVRIIFPSVLPESISQMEKERIEIIQRRLTAEKEFKYTAEKEIESCKAKIKELTQQLTNQETQIHKLEIERDGLMSQISDYYNNREGRAAAIEEIKKALMDKNSIIEDLQRKLNQEQTISNELRSANEGLQKRIEQLSLTSQCTLKGVVIVEDMKHDTRAAFPIYEGLNTYGSNPDMGLHHQIKFHVTGYTFLPIHFRIQTSTKGLKIEAVPGVDLYQNGGLVQTAVYARQADNFICGDNKVRINISPII